MVSLSLQSSPYSTFSHSLSLFSFTLPSSPSLLTELVKPTNLKLWNHNPLQSSILFYPSIFLLYLLFVITWKWKLKGGDFGFPLGQTEDPSISLGLGFTRMAVVMIGCDSLWWVFIFYLQIRFVVGYGCLWWLVVGFCGIGRWLVAILWLFVVVVEVNLW